MVKRKKLVMHRETVLRLENGVDREDLKRLHGGTDSSDFHTDCCWDKPILF